MSKWWESDRSKLAASVRATRRRLRQNYRNAVARGVAAKSLALDAEYRAKCERLAIAEARAIEAAATMTRPEIAIRDFQLVRLVGCEVSIHRDLFLRAKNPSEMIGAIAEMIGRAVQEKVYEYARKETRPFGQVERRERLSL